VIERVETEGALRSLRGLLAEYEEDLPADLRHDEDDPHFDAAFLARFEDAYAGCVAVTVRDPATAILRHLYVRPAFRGRGAARALSEAAIGFARECRCDRIVLDTEAQRLSAAAALYRSLGFIECEPYARVNYSNPTFMELQLHEASSG